MCVIAKGSSSRLYLPACVYNVCMHVCVYIEGKKREVTPLIGERV